MAVERPRRSIHGCILGTVRAVEPQAVPFGDAGLEDRTRSVVPIETDVVVATDEDVAVHVTDPSQNVRRRPERRVRATTTGQVTLLALLVQAIGVTASLVRCRSTDDSRCALAEVHTTDSLDSARAVAIERLDLDESRSPRKR